MTMVDKTVQGHVSTLEKEKVLIQKVARSENPQRASSRLARLLVTRLIMYGLCCPKDLCSYLYLIISFSLCDIACVKGERSAAHLNRRKGMHEGVTDLDDGRKLPDVVDASPFSW